MKKFVYVALCVVILLSKVVYADLYLPDKIMVVNAELRCCKIAALRYLDEQSADGKPRIPMGVNNIDLLKPYLSLYSFSYPIPASDWEKWGISNTYAFYATPDAIWIGRSVGSDDLVVRGDMAVRGKLQEVSEMIKYFYGSPNINTVPISNDTAYIFASPDEAIWVQVK